MTARPWLRYPAATIHRTCPRGYPYRSQEAALSNVPLHDAYSHATRCDRGDCDGWHITIKESA